MPFNPQERATLLAVKGIGPTVVKRLQEMGFSSLERHVLLDQDYPY